MLPVRRAWGAALVLVAGISAAAGQPLPEPAAAAMARAQALLAAGRTDEAASVLRALVEREPGHAPAHLQLGRIALEAEDAERARGHLEAALAAGPRRPVLAWHLLGRAHLLGGDAERAEAAFGEALERAPGLVPARVGRARARLRLERVGEAAEDLRRAAATGERAPEATLLLAEVWLLEERDEEARELLDRLLSAPDARIPDARTPGAQGGWARTAALLRQAAEGPGGATALRTAVGEHLDLAAASLALGLSLLRAGEAEAADWPLRAALEIDDRDPVPWLLLRRLGEPGGRTAYPEPLPGLSATLEAARRAVAEGDPVEADRLAAGILARRPHHVPARLVRIEAAARRDDAWAELRGFRELLDRLPEVPSLQAGAARVALRMGALEAARCWADRALEAIPAEATLHFLRCAVEAEAGEHDAAAAACRKSLALGEEAAAVWVTLGRVEFERMRIAESIAAFRRALELDPQAVEAIPAFALSSLGAAEAESLRELLAAYLEVRPESAAALRGLAWMRLESDDPDSALQLFRRLTRADPTDARAHYGLGQIHVRLGERELGEAALARFRELQEAEEREWLKQNRAFRFRLEAGEARAGGDPRAAVAIYRRLAADGTATVEDYLGAGGALLEIGDPGGAAAWFDRVLAAAPYDPRALEGRAEAASRLGEEELGALYRERLELLSSPCPPPAREPETGSWDPPTSRTRRAASGAAA